LPPEIESRDKEISLRIRSVADDPEMGWVVPEIDQTFLRVLIHPPNYIVYRHDLIPVSIVRTRRSEWLLYLAATDDEA